MRARIIGLGFVLALCGGLTYAQQCLHEQDETPQERQRKMDAVNLVRLINTAELDQKMRSGKYVPAAELWKSPFLNDVVQTGKARGISAPLSFAPGADVLPGFELRLTTDGNAYSVLLMDKTDPCRFGFFSDQVGVIFHGEPIR